MHGFKSNGLALASKLEYGIYFLISIAADVALFTHSLDIRLFRHESCFISLNKEAHNWPLHMAFLNGVHL